MLDIHPHIQAIKQKHCQPTSTSQRKHQGGKQDVLGGAESSAVLLHIKKGLFMAK